jgi:hypothetical protein
MRHSKAASTTDRKHGDGDSDLHLALSGMAETSLLPIYGKLSELNYCKVFLLMLGGTRPPVKA